MRVLVAFPKDGETGTFIARAFLSLGCYVTELDPRKERGEITTYLEMNPGTLVVCSRTPELANLAGLRYYRKLVCWNTDVRSSLDVFFRHFTPQLDQLWKRCDAIYTMAKGQVCEYRKRYPGKHIRWLSQGIDPETHKVEVASKEEQKRYSCDVMFAGSYKKDGIHGNRWKLLEEVGKRFDLRLYGYKDKITGREHNLACRWAGVVLGCSAYPQIELSMSVRDYKVMGAGGLLLTNRVKGIENWFGDYAFYYDSVQDCLRMIERLLNMDAQAAEDIADEGAEYMLAEHTYAHRCQVILDDMRKGLF